MTEPTLKIFILEDNPNRLEAFKAVLAGHDLTIAAGVGDATSVFAGPYDMAFLDHDLEGQQMVPSNGPTTGFQFVSWLVDHHPKDSIKMVIVHSWNPEGAGLMTRTLKFYGFDALEMPFSQHLLQALIVGELEP